MFVPAGEKIYRPVPIGGPGFYPQLFLVLHLVHLDDDAIYFIGESLSFFLHLLVIVHALVNGGTVLYQFIGL